MMTYPRRRLGILLLATGFSCGCDWFPPGENGDTTPTLPAPTSFPDEICDGKDNNQDGRVDEGFDLDGDKALSAELCPGLGRDCDDHDPGFAPNAEEPFGTPTDYNCDGKVVLRAPFEAGLLLTHVTIPGMAPASVSIPAGQLEANRGALSSVCQESGSDGTCLVARITVSRSGALDDEEAQAALSSEHVLLGGATRIDPALTFVPSSGEADSGEAEATQALLTLQFESDGSVGCDWVGGYELRGTGANIQAIGPLETWSCDDTSQQLAVVLPNTGTFGPLSKTARVVLEPVSEGRVVTQVEAEPGIPFEQSWRLLSNGVPVSGHAGSLIAFLPEDGDLWNGEAGLFEASSSLYDASFTLDSAEDDVTRTLLVADISGAWDHLNAASMLQGCGESALVLLVEQGLAAGVDNCQSDKGCYSFSKDGVALPDDRADVYGCLSVHLVREKRWYLDSDGDGYGDPDQWEDTATAPAGYVPNGEDCNDGNAAVHPGAVELCDAFNVDEDCNGLADDADPSAQGKSNFYPDQDGDSYGANVAPTKSCELLDGYAKRSGDCDDTIASTNPAAAEQCDGKDNNCNGTVDENVTQLTWYQDSDGDSYGNDAVTTKACVQPPGYVQRGGDCNDANPAVHPGASESVADGVDQDCDKQELCYRDADGDGYEPSDRVTVVSGDLDCTDTGEAASAQSPWDCDDTNVQVNPAATEVCGDGIDNNCDGVSTTSSTWYRDADGDGYGTPSATTQACTQPSGYVSQSGDCSDGNASIHPGATETCNGVDEDCDGVIDDGAPGITWYRDADGDGYGSPSVTTQACIQPTGYVSNSNDCNDGNAQINPTVSEVCGDGIDNNCDGNTDTSSTWYKDVDGDGYGSGSSTTQACSKPSGYVSNSSDCNDANVSVNPGASETCNGVDDDCDGSKDEGLSCPVVTSGLNLKVVGGSGFTLDLRANGRVLAFGRNDKGQLGDGGTTSHMLPTEVFRLNDIVDIDAGECSGAAVDSEGRLFTWGCNDSGQLGYSTSGAAVTISRLVTVTGNPRFIAVRLGKAFTVALDDQGQVWAAGLNASGQLGNGSLNTSSTFQRVMTAPGVVLTGVKAIAAGDDFAVAVGLLGELIAWGENGNGQSGNGNTADLPYASTIKPDADLKDVAAGSCHGLGLTSSGAALSWGCNTNGQLARTGSSGVGSVTQPGSVSALGAGANHSLFVLTGNGQVASAGLGTDGQLGNDSLNSTGTLVTTNLTNAVAVEGGVNHSVALLKDGSLRVFGDNASGQLSDMTLTDRNTPVSVKAVIQTAAGDGFSLALWFDGTVSGVGYNGLCPLGNDASGNPFPGGASWFTLQGLKDVLQLSAGDAFSLFLLADGRVRGLGANSLGQLGIGTVSDYECGLVNPGLSGVEAVSAGADFAAALLRDGTVKTWGNGYRGQLGNGKSGDGYVEQAPVAVLNLAGIVDLEAGTAHLLTIKRSAVTSGFEYRAYANGEGSAGQIGDASSSQVPRTQSVEVQSSVGVLTLSGGLRHTLVVKDDGTLLATGANDRGQQCSTSGSSTSLKLVPGFGATLRAVRVSAGHDYSLIYSADRILRACGQNDLYQLGLGYTSSQETTAKSLAYDLMLPVAGEAHSLALSLHSGLYGHGVNADGETGSGSSGTPVFTPTLSKLTSTALGVMSIQNTAVGATHALLLDTLGNVYGAGRGYYGELCTLWSASSFTLIPGLSGVKAVAAGSGFSIFLMADGTLKGCGNSDYGQLGNTISTNTPVTIGGVSNVVAISAGSSHVMALDSSGYVWVWGNNAYGQVGNLSTANTATPYRALTGSVQIAAGASHSMARTSSGQVYVWGLNTSGQIGNGTNVDAMSPNQIISGGATDIAAGSNHSLATVKGGLTVWGYNGSGQLCLGTTTNVNKPTTTSQSVGAGLRASFFSTFFKKSDGTTWGCGTNASGELAQGSTSPSSSSTPLKLSLPTTATILGSGPYSYSLFALDGASLYAWGDNQYGQLGLGTTGTKEPTPKLVPWVVVPY